MKPVPINALRHDQYPVFAAVMLRDNTLGLVQHHNAIGERKPATSAKLPPATGSKGTELSALLAQSVPLRTDQPSVTSRKSP